MAASVILEKATKCYGATVAVNGLSLEVQSGRVLGILGPNGAGKSTTLHLLTGLAKPTSGTVRVFGLNPRKQHVQIARRTGVLFDRPAFYNYLSVRKNLELMATLAGEAVSIDRALDRTGILHLANVRAGTLSTGLRQRLGLAHALMYQPELLLLDEPTSALDEEYTQVTLAILRDLADRAGVTVIFSSHIMSEVESICDDVAILNQGKLLACEPVESMLSYDRSTIDVLIDTPEPAARRLNEEPWVESVEAGPGRLTVRLRDENPHQLNTFLVGAGYRVQGLIPRKRTLQEYFLKAINR